jgi:hypothetical protein
LGQKLRDKGRFVSQSIVMMENPDFGPFLCTVSRNRFSISA